jgi:hypothetical protein
MPALIRREPHPPTRPITNYHTGDPYASHNYQGYHPVHSNMAPSPYPANIHGIRYPAHAPPPWSGFTYEHVAPPAPAPVPPPPPPPQKVWILDCRSCDMFLTNRGMKASPFSFLLLLPAALFGANGHFQIRFHLLDHDLWTRLSDCSLHQIFSGRSPP